MSVSLPANWRRSYRSAAQTLIVRSSAALHKVRALTIALTIATIPWHLEAQTQKLFENDRVIAWKLALGERTEPLIRDRRLPGVLVALADGTVRIFDDVNAITARDVAPGSSFVLIAIKQHPPSTLQIPVGMTRAFPRKGVRRVFDNDRVTVWNVAWTKGLKTPPHFHDRDVVVIYLDAGTVRSIPLSGEPTATPRVPGETVFIPGGRAHIEECIDGPRRDIVIELK